MSMGMGTPHSEVVRVQRAQKSAASGSEGGKRGGKCCTSGGMGSASRSWKGKSNASAGIKYNGVGSTQR